MISQTNLGKLIFEKGIMEDYRSLIEAFEMLNEQKRADPSKLGSEPKKRWRVLRCQIEQALFQRKMDPDKDAREFIRVPIPLWVCYRSADRLVEKFCSVLGEGGLFIASEEPLAPGTKLNLEIIPLRRGLSFSIKAEVVWSSRHKKSPGPGMGLRFIDLSDQQRQLVNNLVDDAIRQGLLERRNHARIDTHLEMNVEWSMKNHRLLSRDLSLGGVYVILSKAPPLGNKVWLDISVPALSKSFNCVAEAIHDSAKPPGSDDTGCGLAFFEPNLKELETIRSYMVDRVCGRILPSMDEPRRYGRLIRRIKTKYQAVDSSGISDVRDIGAGGAFLLHRRPPPLDSEIELMLVHPVTPQILTVRGRVVRVANDDPSRPYLEPGVGIEFEELKADRRRSLVEFLSDLVRLESLDRQRWEK